MVVAAGISRGNIKYHVDKGMIEKAARGVYSRETAKGLGHQYYCYCDQYHTNGKET